MLYGEAHANHGLLPQSGLYRHGAGNADARNQRKPQDLFDSPHGITPSLFPHGIDRSPAGDALVSYILFLSNYTRLKTKRQIPSGKTEKIIRFFCTKII